MIKHVYTRFESEDGTSSETEWTVTKQTGSFAYVQDNEGTVYRLCLNELLSCGSTESNRKTFYIESNAAAIEKENSRLQKRWQQVDSFNELLSLPSDYTKQDIEDRQSRIEAENAGEVDPAAFKKHCERLKKSANPT